MDATQASAALEAWAKATCPDLVGSYHHNPSRKTAPLPDVAASCGSEQVRRNAPELGIAVVDQGLEQADVHVLNMEMLLMAPPEPAAAATAQLQTFVAQLSAALLADDTLGGRVVGASRYFQASYDPPYIEFDDGTKGRCCFFNFAVAELAVTTD